MSASYNSRQKNTADNALLNASTSVAGIQGRQSPLTYVRDSEASYTANSGESPLRERNIPIQLSDQPASPSPLTRTRTPVVIYPSSPAEREPFLPLRSTTPAVADFERDFPPRSTSSTQPRNNLTLVRDMTDTDVDLPDRAGWRHKLSRYTHVSNPLLREGLAEFLGSFILIVSRRTSLGANISQIPRKQDERGHKPSMALNLYSFKR